MTNKANNIETLRGIVILLVVIGHVIGSTPKGGMKIDYSSYWRYLYLWIDYIQMPLFTAIAGWVYALKPVEKDVKFYSFIQKKALRLLLPMSIVATLYFIIQYYTPNTNQKGNLFEIWKIYIFPYSIYWYLPSLFIIFTITFFLDKIEWLKDIKGWSVCIIISYLIMIITNELIPYEYFNIFSYKGALILLPYFITGVGINRFSKKIFSNKAKITYFILAMIGIFSLQMEWFYPISGNIIYNSLEPIWIIALLFLILHQNYTNLFFTWLANYAYTIYLFHGFGTSGGRIILQKANISNNLFIIIGATIIAILGSIIIDYILNKKKVTKILFLGKYN